VINNSDIPPRWEVIGGKKTVIVCAERRPTYECKRDWEKAFRKEVQNALRSLVADKGEMLVAKYGSDAADAIDTENALFYNFAAPVSQSACYGVAYKTLCPEEMYLTFHSLGKQGYNHLYIYSLEPIALAPGEERDIEPFVRWTDIPIITMRIESAAYFFTVMRQNPKCFLVYGHGQMDGDFGVNIRIQSPSKEPFKLTAIMKPLLDGVISSFHRLPKDANVDELTDKSISLYHTAGEWKGLLIDERNSVLPPYQYVKPYRRDSLQWSPMDDRCKEARITANYGADKWSFSGEIYEVFIDS